MGGGHVSIGAHRGQRLESNPELELYIGGCKHPDMGGCWELNSVLLKEQ